MVIHSSNTDENKEMPFNHESQTDIDIKKMIDTSKSIKFSDLNEIISEAKNCVAAKKNYINLKNSLSVKCKHLTEEYGEEFEELFRLMFPSESF